MQVPTRETRYTFSLRDMVDKLHQFQRLVMGSLSVVTWEHQVWFESYLK